MGLAGSALSPFSPLSSQKLLAQQASITKKHLVTVFLRGGADGLQLIPPTGANISISQKLAYETLRPALSEVNLASEDKEFGFTPEVDRLASHHPDLTPLKLDGYFELNPALSALQDLYLAGDLAIIPGVGGWDSRSHFAAQDAVEWAVPASSTLNKTTGWMHDCLDLILNLDSTYPIQTMMGLSFNSSVFKAMHGDARSQHMFSMGGLSDFRVDLSTDKINLIYDQFNRNVDVYAGVKSSVVNSLDLEAQLAGYEDDPYIDEHYFIEANTNSNFVKQMADIALLINSDEAPPFTSLNIGGWDTHEDQWDRLNLVLHKLSNSIRGFFEVLTQEAKDNTLILVCTEFGRTLDRNGSLGTDHGRGATWMVIGNSVNGGVYDRYWGGLPLPIFNDDGTLDRYEPDPAFDNVNYTNPNPNLTSNTSLNFQNDGRPLLATMLDYRSVYRSLIEDFIGVPNSKSIFGLADHENFDFDHTITDLFS